MKKYAVMLCMVAIACGGSAQSLPGADAAAVATESAERARIRNDRAQADARYTMVEQACYQKFAVSSCLEEAKLARRETLRELSRQERLLNQRARQEKSAERLSALEKKSAANKARRERAVAETGSNGAAQTTAPATTRQAGAALNGVGTASVRNPKRSRTAVQAEAPRSDEAGIARHQKKIQQAEQRRAKRDSKQQTRTKAPAAGLPVPE